MKLSTLFVGKSSAQIFRMIAIPSAGILGIALVTGVTSANLTAIGTNASAQSIASGSLNLTLANSTATSETAGFSSTTPITGMVPGDVQYRYIDLKQGATQGTALLPTLALSATGDTSLTSDNVRGIQFTVNNCTVAWTFVNATSASTCSGIQSVVLASTGGYTLRTAQALTNFTLAQNTTNFLQIIMTLPANTTNNETTTNAGTPVVTNGAQTITAVQAKTVANAAVSFTMSSSDAAQLAVGEYFSVAGFTGNSIGFNGAYHVLTSSGTTVTATPVVDTITNTSAASAQSVAATEPTIQSQTAAATFTFTEQQRTATTTNA